MRYRKHANRSVVLLALFLSCVFTGEDNRPLEMIRIDSTSDTVSLWPELKFAFSVPLKDSLVSIALTPDPGPVYSVRLNKSRDTLTVPVSGSLQGSTRYSLAVQKTLTATNGSVLEPEQAVFDIVTYPGEREPNNSRFQADTLVSVCFGSIAPANDTDCFYINTVPASYIYCISHEKRCGFIIRTAADSTVAADNSLTQIKTFEIPGTLSMPLFVSVFSLYDNDVRYEIGLSSAVAGSEE